MLLSFEPDRLIDQGTGKIDWAYLRAAAYRRAWLDRASEPPPALIRSWVGNYTEMATGLAERWHRERHLPNPVEYVPGNLNVLKGGEQQCRAMN